MIDTITKLKSLSGLNEPFDADLQVFLIVCPFH